MEAREVLQAVRARGGLSQAELARMASVAPSTVSRVERGELDPTWSVMNKLLQSAGYESTGELSSSGDVNAVAAARAVLGELGDSARNDRVRAWVDRWTRARFIDETGYVRNVEKIGVQAGNASRIFDRPNPKLSVVYERSWQDIVKSLQKSGIRYAVSGITATSPTRVSDGAAWPLIYVDSIPVALAAAGLREQLTSGPRITLMGFDDLSATGTVVDEGLTFASPGQALIDSYAGPGRMADQADAVAARWQASMADFG